MTYEENTSTEVSIPHASDIGSGVVTSQKTLNMGPAGTETKNDCAGEGQQELNRRNGL
jgi:hypothetical protein